MLTKREALVLFLLGLIAAPVLTVVFYHLGWM